MSRKFSYSSRPINIDSEYKAVMPGQKNIGARVVSQHIIVKARYVLIKILVKEQSSPV